MCRIVRTVLPSSPLFLHRTENALCNEEQAPEYDAGKKSISTGIVPPAPFELLVNILYLYASTCSFVSFHSGVYLFLFNKTDIPLHQIQSHWIVNRNLQNENMVIEYIVLALYRQMVGSTDRETGGSSKQTMTCCDAPGSCTRIDVRHGDPLFCWAGREAGERVSACWA